LDDLEESGLCRDCLNFSIDDGDDGDDEDGQTDLYAFCRRGTVGRRQPDGRNAASVFSLPENWVAEICFRISNTSPFSLKLRLFDQVNLIVILAALEFLRSYAGFRAIFEAGRKVAVLVPLQLIPDSGTAVLSLRNRLRLCGAWLSRRFSPSNNCSGFGMAILAGFGGAA
jgi:hypothetical protein